MKFCPNCEVASVSLPRAILANHAFPASCPSCGALCVSAFRWWALLPAIAIFIPLFAVTELFQGSWLHVPAGVAAVVAYLVVYTLVVPLQHIQRASVVVTRWFLAALIVLLAASRAAIYFSGGGA